MPRQFPAEFCGCWSKSLEDPGASEFEAIRQSASEARTSLKRPCTGGRARLGWIQVNDRARLGTLGYSPTDNRYEWSTVDSVTPMMMVYKGAKDSGGAAEISMAGEFTDPGVLGERYRATP